MKIISKDLRDGEKLPERHVFNGMGYQDEAAHENAKAFHDKCEKRYGAFLGSSG